MEHLPFGTIEVDASQLRDSSTRTAVERLQQLGVSIRSPASAYDFELQLRHDVEYPIGVLVEVGYLLAQLTGHEFPAGYKGFSWATGRVPQWNPEGTFGERIRMDTDPACLSFRFSVED